VEQHHGNVLIPHQSETPSAPGISPDRRENRHRHVDIRGRVRDIQKMNLDSPVRKTVPKLRRQLREATTAGILQAAEEVLAERGYLKTRMQAIAERAGVAVGTIYNHYRSREGLLMALFHARRRELFLCLQESGRATAGAPFMTQLESLVTAILSLYETHRPFVRIAVETEHLRARFRAGRTSADRRPSVQQIQAAADRIVRVGIEEGALKAEGAAIYPSILTRIILGVLAEGSREGSPPLPDHAGLVIDMFLHGASAS
jgi:AcrR family transcriptional regulator